MTSTSATFGFSSSEAGSTFERSLDQATFTSCTSPRQYTGLGVGSHEIRVRATDASCNADETPAVRTWTVTPACSTVTVGADRDSWVLQSTAASAPSRSSAGYMEWMVTSQVQNMYSGSNHGFLIRDATENGSGNQQSFHSREKAPDNPPQLVVTFG